MEVQRSVGLRLPITKAFAILDGIRLDKETGLLLFQLESIALSMEELAITFWQIWFNRNRIVHLKPDLLVDEIISWVHLFLSEFQTANQRVPSVRHRTEDKWKVPAADAFKINTDAALDLFNSRVGLGAVIQNEEGHVLISSSLVVQAKFSPEVAKAMAIL
ncbi:hypothetical protein ACOSP7_028583 [Xanthoceras sorbifolium]